MQHPCESTVAHICSVNHEEVGDRDKRNPGNPEYTIVKNTRPYLKQDRRQELTSEVVLTSTYTLWHAQTHTHMYTCTQICTVAYTCIQIHKSLKKKDTAQPLKQKLHPQTLASSFHSSALLQTLSLSISIHWSLQLQTHPVLVLCHNVLLLSMHPSPPHPSTPISVLARWASAKWVSSVKSGDFLHK